MLSCSCPDYNEGEYYTFNLDFSTLKTNRRKRCCSCKELINIGTVCVNFRRFRDPCTDLEERIHGDEVELATWYMCEKCGEIFFNLEDLKYCLDIGQNMNDYLQEYWELTEFEPPKNFLDK